MILRRRMTTRKKMQTLPVTEAVIKEFANSKYPIDIFCQYNNVCKEDLEQALHNKMEAFKEQSKVNTTSESSDFVEIKNFNSIISANNTEADTFDIFDDTTKCFDSFKNDINEKEVESPIIRGTAVNENFSQPIKIKIGKATIEVPMNISQNNLQKILGVLAAI